MIPGPREPSLDEINHFLHPVVEFFLPAWKNGTWFTKTDQHPEGCLACSVIAVAVNDLPAAQKICRWFCRAYHGKFLRPCWLQKLDISNILCETWKHRMRQEHLAVAIQWRDAETKKRQVLNLQRYWCTMVRATSLAVLGSPSLHSDRWHAQSLPWPGSISFQRPYRYRQARKPRRPQVQHHAHQTSTRKS